MFGLDAAMPRRSRRVVPHRSNGRVVIAALWSCRLGFDSESLKPMTVQLVFTASLLDAQNQRDSVENKQALTCCAVGKGAYNFPASSL